MKNVRLNWSEFLGQLNNWEEVIMWFENKIVIAQKDYATEFNVLHVYLNPNAEIKFEDSNWDYQVSIPSLVILRKYLIEIGVDFE